MNSRRVAVKKSFRLMKAILLISIFTLSACVNLLDDKQTIDEDEVEYIEIQKRTDSIPFRLSPEQAADFVKRWNSSTAKGMYKYLVSYYLTVHFKKDSTLDFRTSGELIKQRNDCSYSVGDKSYFKTLWYSQAGLADDYVQYHPTYWVNDEYSTEENPLTAEHLKAIKQVLTYYHHKWVDVRGMVFYRGNIDTELIGNYTSKAEDSSWLSSHH